MFLISPSSFYTALSHTELLQILGFYTLFETFILHISSVVARKKSYWCTSTYFIVKNLEAELTFSLGIW